MHLTHSSQVFPRVFAHQSIDSTNAELLRLSALQLPEFSAVIAAAQTAGKGRLGRDWQSPEGASLALSVLIRPKSASELNWVTLTAGLSVQEAVSNLGVTAGIKWPNDVLVQGKKLCGILASNQDGDIALGIGVNLNHFQGQLDSAVALGELGVEADLDQVAAEIGKRLVENFERFRADSAEVMERFRANCITLRQSVRAEFPDGTQAFGVAEEINQLGQLVILTPEPMALSAADVWHLRN